MLFRTLETARVVEAVNAMKGGEIYVAYGKSLCWGALIIASTVGFAFIVLLIFTDVIHGNPYRTGADVFLMIVVEIPIISSLHRIDFSSCATSMFPGRSGRFFSAWIWARRTVWCTVGFAADDGSGLVLL